MWEVVQVTPSIRQQAQTTTHQLLQTGTRPVQMKKAPAITPSSPEPVMQAARLPAVISSDNSNTANQCEMW